MVFASPASFLSGEIDSRGASFMAWVRFAFGWLIWHIRAGWWYLTLGFRLYFAVGLDRDFHPSKDTDVGRHFRCPFERGYRAHLNREPNPTKS